MFSNVFHPLPTPAPSSAICAEERLRAPQTVYVDGLFLIAVGGTPNRGKRQKTTLIKRTQKPMRTLQRIRNFFARLIQDDMKPERAQEELVPGSEVPMNPEGIQAREHDLPEDWSLVTAPVAIRYWHRFATFSEAAQFVANEVSLISEHFGFSPSVRIEGTDVALTLGIDATQILAEADFGFATALDAAMNEVTETTGDEPTPPAETATPTEGTRP